MSYGQDQKKRTWKQEKEYLEYKKNDKYEGPEDWYGSYPADMDRDYGSSGSGYNGSGTYNGGTYNGGTYNGGSSSGNQGIQYSPQQIQQDRDKRFGGVDRGGGNGDLPFDPEVEMPEPPELPDLPDIDAPDIDAPDIDLPDVDGPSLSSMQILGRILLFLLIAAAIAIIIWLIVRNSKPRNKKIVVDVENDWNPEVITKTELELRLEAAIARGDYRECVRIYFTFILKELIKKSWISWKRDKTNYQYVMEMHKRPNRQVFAECVRIYDLVWYGEYEIDQSAYDSLQPTLEKYYKSLDPKGE